MMMEGIKEKNNEDAYCLMVSMLESRTRAWNALKSIVGSPSDPDTKRIAVFNNWYEENKGVIGAGKLGFLRFFLDIQQSFVSHILPMFGDSAEYCQSEKDKMKSEKMMDILAEKIGDYIGIDLDNVTDEELAALTPEKRQALQLWNKWLNPDEFFTAEQNMDPLSQDWSENVYDTLQDAIDAVINLNIGAGAVTRQRFAKYKTDMEDYNDEVEEEKKLETDAEKKQRKLKEEQKAYLQKLQAINAAKAREYRGEVKPAAKAGLKPKVAAVAKRLNTMTKPKDKPTAWT